jgi:tetratricopeptide (TPR) repeat protein
MSVHVDDPRAVGRRLREARTRAALSQRELAAGLCTAAYVSRLEAGARVPSLQLLQELGRRLGVSGNYLATGTIGDGDSSTRLMDAEIALRLDQTEEARDLCEAVLEHSADSGARSRALECLGQVALRDGRFQEAITAFEDSLALRCTDVVTRPWLAESLARAYASIGRSSTAIGILERCTQEYERKHDRLQYVRFACLLGAALAANAEVSRAEEILEKASAAAREADAHERARGHWLESRSAAEKGQVVAANSYACRALGILVATEDMFTVGQTLQTLARIRLDLGRPEEAVALLDEALPFVHGAGRPTEVARHLTEHARALAAMGDSAAATTVALRAKEYLEQAQPRDSARACLLLAEVWEELGEPDYAKELSELAIARLEGHPPSRQLFRAYRKLAALLKLQGRTAEALELLERAIDLEDAPELEIG